MNETQTIYERLNTAIYNIIGAETLGKAVLKSRDADKDILAATTALLTTLAAVTRDLVGIQEELDE